MSTKTDDCSTTKDYSEGYTVELTEEDDNDHSHDGMAVVDGTWVVVVPEGFRYCTDKSIIGSNRNIVILEDKDGSDFKWPFEAAISFTSTFSEVNDMPAPAFAKMAIRFMCEGNETVVKDEEDLYAAYCFSGSYADTPDEELNAFKIEIGCGTGVSEIQVFFNNCGMTIEKETELVDRLSKSIKLTKSAKRSNSAEKKSEEPSEQPSKDTHKAKAIKKQSKDEEAEFLKKRYSEKNGSLGSVISEKNIQAVKLIIEGDPQSLMKAEGIFSELEKIDDDQARYRTYEETISKIRDFRGATIDIGRLSEELEKLGGLRNRKKRLAAEGKMREAIKKKEESKQYLSAFVEETRENIKSPSNSDDRIAPEAESGFDII